MSESKLTVTGVAFDITTHVGEPNEEHFDFEVYLNQIGNSWIRVKFENPLATSLWRALNPKDLRVLLESFSGAEVTIHHG